jgi:hypothetical protein
MMKSLQDKILWGAAILFLILFLVQTCRYAKLQKHCNPVIGEDTTKKVTVKPNVTTDSFIGKPPETTVKPVPAPSVVIRWLRGDTAKPVIPPASKNYDSLKWQYDSLTGLYYMALGDIEELQNYYNSPRTFFKKYELKGRRGFIAVWDTLSGNQFVNRRLVDSLICYDTLTETTITRTVERDALQVYLGVGLSGSEQDPFRLLQAEILFKGSRGGGIGLTATKDLNNVLPMQYGIKKLWLISFRKKKK